MSNQIVKYQSNLTKYQPTTFEEIMKTAELFAASGMFNADNARQSAAQLAVKIIAGQELGFTPFAAANGMQIIKSKCAPGANLMAALVKASSRYDYRVTEMTDIKVSIEFFEHGKAIGVSTFTIQDANKAGTQNTGKYPRNMLFARAISNGVKWYCPDLSNGVAMYTPDELGATVDYETGEIISMPDDVQVVEPMPTPVQRQPIAIAPPSNTGATHVEPVEPAPAIELSADVADFITNLLQSAKTPTELWKWAADNKHTENEHSARTRWTAIVKDQGGYKPEKFNAIATAFVAHYLAKPVAA